MWRYVVNGGQPVPLGREADLGQRGVYLAGRYAQGVRGEARGPAARAEKARWVVLVVLAGGCSSVMLHRPLSRSDKGRLLLTQVPWHDDAVDWSSGGRLREGPLRSRSKRCGSCLDRRAARLPEWILQAGPVCSAGGKEGWEWVRTVRVVRGLCALVNRQPNHGQHQQ